MPNHKVLIPLNQSELSQRILPYVTKFIPASENDLILFFVTKPPSAAGFGEPDLAAGYPQMPGDQPVRPTLHPIYATQQQDSIKAHVEAELTPEINKLKAAGFNVTLMVDFGKEPVSAITREITKSKIDLVAMSTLARVGVTRFFFRNIADSIAQKSNIPVLLIHPQSAGTA